MKMAYEATYTSGDVDDIAIDIVGTFMAGLAENAAIIVTLIVIALIVVLAVDLMKGTFGIVAFFRGKGRV